MFRTTFTAVALAAATAISTVAPAEAAFAGRNAPRPVLAAEGVDVQQVHMRRGGRNLYRHNRRARHLPPHRVRRMLRRQGFHHIRFTDRHPPVYRVRASDRRGRQVVLVVSSRSGQVMRRWRPRYH